MEISAVSLWIPSLVGVLSATLGVDPDYSDSRVTFMVDMGRPCATSRSGGTSIFYDYEMLEDGATTLRYTLTAAGIKYLRSNKAPVISHVLMHTMVRAKKAKAGETVVCELNREQAAVLIAQMTILDKFHAL